MYEVFVLEASVPLKHRGFANGTTAAHIVLHGRSHAWTGSSEIEGYEYLKLCEVFVVEA